MKLNPENLAELIVEGVSLAVNGPRVAGRLDALEARIQALERQIAELQAAPSLKDADIWRHGSTYHVGDVSQFKGSS